jgi:hypothetical protein
VRTRALEERGEWDLPTLTTLSTLRFYNSTSAFYFARCLTLGAVSFPICFSASILVFSFEELVAYFYRVYCA